MKIAVYDKTRLPSPHDSRNHYLIGECVIKQAENMQGKLGGV